MLRRISNDCIRSVIMDWERTAAPGPTVMRSLPRRSTSPIRVRNSVSASVTLRLGPKGSPWTAKRQASVLGGLRYRTARVPVSFRLKPDERGLSERRKHKGQEQHQT